MPTNKDLKRLVRARMRRTGEAYTTARAQILRKPPRKKVAVSVNHTVAQSLKKSATPSVRSAGGADAAVKPSEYAALAGMSDASIKRGTGCTWERWVRSLDHHGAGEMSHREIASLVRTKYKTPSWWTQTVAVGYERIRGLRARGQRRNGTYEMTKSRTFNVPLTVLYDAWANASVRQRWSKRDDVRVRTARRPKSMRLDWGSEGILAAGFLAKGVAKSSVAISVERLPDRDAAERLKLYWSERLDDLGRELTALRG